MDYNIVSIYKEFIKIIDKSTYKLGLIDYMGNIIVPCIYEDIGYFSQNRLEVAILIEDNLKYGFIDIKGNVITDCIYDKVKEFSEGLCAVCKNEKWGYIDLSGNLVIDFIYNKANSFSEGYASVDTDAYLGFINKNNVFIKLNNCDTAESFSNGLLLVSKYICSEQNNEYRYGYVNTEGKLVIDFIYNQAAAFSEDIALVKLDKKQLLINTFGEIILELSNVYNYLGKFENGLLLTSLSNLNNSSEFSKVCFGAINKKGEMIIPCIYYQLCIGGEYLIAMIGENFNTSKSGILNYKNEWIIPPNYAYIDIIFENNKYFAILAKGFNKFEYVEDLRENLVIESINI